MGRFIWHTSIFENGLFIVWVNNENFKEVGIRSSARVNVRKIKGEEADCMWRFTKLNTSQ